MTIGMSRFCYTLCILTHVFFIGCGSDRSQVVSEMEPDLQAASKGLRFIESVLYVPIGDGTTVGKEHISDTRMSEDLALTAFSSIQEVKRAMLESFGAETELGHIRLFLFDQFNQENQGRIKRLPTFWVVLPKYGSVISEDRTVTTIEQFVVKLEKELSIRPNADEAANLNKQIEFLRAIP